MSVLAIIPARSGSKSIHKKNIVECAGRPLIYWTAHAAQQSKNIKWTALSTDSAEISKKINPWKNFFYIKRPLYLALDNSATIETVRHAVNFMKKKHSVEPEIIIILQPTSPLRTSFHIDEALEILINDTEADSIVSVTKIPHQYSPTSIMIEKDKYIENWFYQDETKNIRQLKPKFIARNGAAIYAFKTSCLIDKKSIFGDKILPYFMRTEVSIDIDNEFDLKLCDFLLKERTRNDS